jgi:hypothetical protein
MITSFLLIFCSYYGDISCKTISTSSLQECHFIGRNMEEVAHATVEYSKARHRCLTIRRKK